ncbi:phosphoribosylformylglycinamidine synthase subunit PurQ [Taibaiella koreensis]|uniref:phosphoribosylformylglycinamidine synthase subunit PurQ n=1 Tax=Taibaiella koreensis TaxID=1268548 RepID=UPI000E59D924|nr:phosphoribosylformylglycinamidine synthase subunit PurQ [Taibaiella koreensis]
MKFGIVVFPGSNCDRDMQHALQDDLQQEVIMLWHKDKDLSMFSTDDCIVLPGGFSYGDYLRCGALARFSPMMEQVIDFANRGGKVLGVCNGFQILCEAGLLPGVLLQNDSRKFICRNVHIRKTSEQNLIGKAVADKALKIPVAHGEGRYFADEATLARLEQNNQVVFQYCDENGVVDSQFNPNGAINDIAGICNEGRNVYGMMPHPERACSETLNNTDGREILKALVESWNTVAA